MLRCDAIDYAKNAESPADTEGLSASETSVFLPDLQTSPSCKTVSNIVDELVFCDLHLV